MNAANSLIRDAVQSNHTPIKTIQTTNMILIAKLQNRGLFNLGKRLKQLHLIKCQELSLVWMNLREKVKINHRRLPLMQMEYLKYKMKGRRSRKETKTHSHHGECNLNIEKLVKELMGRHLTLYKGKIELMSKGM